MTSLLLASTIVTLVILSFVAFNSIVNRTITIEGRVVYGDTGRGASGVLVETQGIEGSRRSGWGQAVTDEEGNYRLKSLPRARYNVWVKVDGWTSRALESFEPSWGARAPDLVLL